VVLTCASSISLPTAQPVNQVKALDIKILSLGDFFMGFYQKGVTPGLGSKTQMRFSYISASCLYPHGYKEIKEKSAVDRLPGGNMPLVA
jgi:hypothetical protein